MAFKTLGFANRGHGSKPVGGMVVIISPSEKSGKTIKLKVNSDLAKKIGVECAPKSKKDGEKRGANVDRFALQFCDESKLFALLKTREINEGLLPDDYDKAGNIVTSHRTAPDEVLKAFEMGGATRLKANFILVRHDTENGMLIFERAK